MTLARGLVLFSAWIVVGKPANDDPVGGTTGPVRPADLTVRKAISVLSGERPTAGVGGTAVTPRSSPTVRARAQTCVDVGRLIEAPNAAYRP